MIDSEANIVTGRIWVYLENQRDMLHDDHVSPEQRVWVFIGARNAYIS